MSEDTRITAVTPEDQNNNQDAALEEKTTSAETEEAKGKQIKTEEQQISRKKVRLLFHGGAQSSTDNNTFKNAATLIRDEYMSDADKNIIIRPLYEITDAKDILKKIHAEKDDSIESIDFFVHGDPVGLHFKRSRFLRANQSLYMNDGYEQKNKTRFQYSADLTEIDYKKFTNSAIIEVHGCNVASENEDAYKISMNFARAFSILLYQAGKKRSVVIGRVTGADPNRYGKNSKICDYRHGRRRVYHNGKALLFTTEEDGKQKQRSITTDEGRLAPTIKEYLDNM